MLKFSGYPYLIRGQSCGVRLDGGPVRRARGANVLRSKPTYRPPMLSRRVHARAAGRSPITKLSLRVEMTLEQACPKEYRGAQCAFKDSMIH
jgi:hypothetical protein